MGTNYYYKKDLCKCCGRYDEKHIGKSSCGWVFALHVYPDEGINTLDDWLDILSKKGSAIIDEYNSKISLIEFTDIVKNRCSEMSWEEKEEAYLNNKYICYYKNLQDMLDKNHAIKGPNNLLRSKIYSNHCIGHGEGTWDYFVGDFS